MKNIKKMFFVLTLATLLITVGAVCATDNTTTTDTVSESTISETSDVITTEVTKTSDNTIVNTKNEKKNINSNKNKELKKEPKTIILNNQTFNTYVTNKTFNDNVSDGDIIDAQGLFYGQDYSLTINKAVNFTSTTNDANFSTNSGHFSMNETSSGSNITNINIYNSQVVLNAIQNVTINNITMTVESPTNGLIGMGQGGFSARNNAINVNITNCYFKTSNNGGVSTMVLAGASNFIFENNTIEAIGSVGNLLYLTTYNSPEGSENGNTIIRNNYINANKAVAQAICYGIGLAGENILIENNVIEYGGQCVAPQWGQGSQNNITFINNTIPYGSAALGYSSSVAINNTITNVGSINEAYNNTFGTVSVENTEKFKGNTVENLTITGSNIEITNDNTITGTLTISGSNNTLYSLSTTNITISGSDNNITNSDFEYVLISGKNNRFTNNTVNSTGDYAINITGSSNIISNDTVYSINKLGEAAIYSTQTNTIENIYPECLSYTLTDDNYSQYFDENDYAIESVLPNYSTIILSGDFYDKSFNFKDNVYTIDGNDSALYNSRFSFEDSNIYLNCTTINNTGNVNNSISINGGVVKIIQVNIYDDSDNIEEIVVNGQGHEIMNCIINIDTQSDVTAIKVTQNGSNKIRNNQINITGRDVTAINITGQTINDELDYNKIFINSTNAEGMIITGDDLLNNKINNVNIIINASENARAIVLDDNKSLLNTTLNTLTLTVTAENVSLIEANLQNNNCSNNQLHMGYFNANGTNIDGISIYGNSNTVWNANFVLNGSERIKALTISGDSCVIGRVNPTIVGSNTEDDLLRSVFLTVENSNNFKFNGQCNINLYNATGNVFINGHNNDIGYEVINCYENSAEIILINETNTHITNGVNSQRPLIMINSSSNTINRMPFNRDSTIILNNSNYNIFESDTFNGNESTILEINSTGNIYRSNTFNNNIILTLNNATYTSNNNKKNVTIENSQNSQLATNTITGIVNVKNSDDIILTNNTVTSTEEYAVILDNTTNSIVNKNRLYGQEKQGDHAVSNNDTTNTIQYNIPADEIILTEENYAQYFDENSIFIPETPELVMRLGSDLYNKDLILPNEITFDGAGYTIYNGTITVTGDNKKIIENMTINNSDDRTSSIIVENGQIQFANNNICQKGNNKIAIKLENNTNSKTTINNNIINITGNNNIAIQSNNFTGFSNNNMTITGDNNIAILFANTTNTQYIENNNIEVYTTNPTTEVIIDNATVYFKYNNVTVNSTQEENPIVKVINNNQTEVTNNYLESSDLIGSFAVDTEGKCSDNLPLQSLILTDDNYDTYFENSTYISKYEQITLGSDLHNKDLKFNVKLLFKGSNYTIYNGTITNDNENVTIQNTNIVNGSIVSTEGYITITNVNINNTDNHTAMVLNGTSTLENNTIYQETNNTIIVSLENGRINSLQYNKIIGIGNNITLLSTNAITQRGRVNNNELISIGDNNIALHVLAYLYELTQNNITMNATTPVTAILYDTSGASINNNHIVLNTTQGDNKIIIANNFRNSWINNNYVEALDMGGNNAIESNGGISNNLPILTLYLTDDNYDQYFTDGIFKANHEFIELASDLHNKDLIITKDVIFNGNGYTIYNGTINVTASVTIENTTINNTDERSSSIISTGTISFKNNTIYQETNDTNIISLVSGNVNLFEDNKIIAIGNNINLTDINARSNTIQNNELISIGENNIAIHITQYSYEIKNNNITMNATTPVIAIQYDRNGNSINNNHIIANTTQGDTKLVIATNFRGHWINDNYIESLDMFGNDAIQTDGNINNNWPTSTSAHESMINIELPETMIANKENTITVTPTDLLGRTITGQITITDGETTTTTTENTITYIPTSSGEKTLTITYTDPTGKYNTITTEITIKVLKTTLTIDPITATAGQTINLTARITIDNQTLTNINKGKITFKVNGKTLKDANGKVIYAKVINGVATIENYVVPDDWSKDGTTIQAVYSGSTQCDKLTSEKTELNITSPETTLTITPITDDVQTGSTITLKAKVAAGDKAITTGKIVFKINGKTVKDANGKVIYAHVDSNGEVSVDYNLGNLKAGSYTIEATFMAPGYDKITSNTTMTVVKA